MSDAVGGLSAQEEAAFAAMQNEQAIEPESEEVETEGTEPEVEAEEPAIEEETGEEEAQPAKKSSMVPHAALHKEREERKRVERLLTQANEERARFDERLRVIQEMQKPVAAEPEPVPDPEEDPIGALKWMTAQIKQREQQEAQRSQQSAADRQREENNQRFIQAYSAASQEFEREAPESRAAYDHWFASLREDFEMEGYDRATANQMAQQREANIAHAAMVSGVNPRERIVEMAKRRGWVPKAAPRQAEERVAAAAEAVSRNKSLSSAGGASTSAQMTAERLVAMSDDDFHAWTVKNPASAKRLLGG